MTPVVVNDASCLIDLDKGELLSVFCDLSYQIVIPLPVREEELNFSKNQWGRLDKSGMITHDLTSDETNKAELLSKNHPRLSVYDCFCLITAQVYSGILLTGDALLRKVAEKKDISVHGVLWVVDELNSAGICDKALLIRALKSWQQDNTVFLPQHKIVEMLENLEGF